MLCKGVRLCVGAEEVKESSLLDVVFSQSTENVQSPSEPQTFLTFSKERIKRNGERKRDQR